MNHIDEGLKVLDEIDSTLRAKQAYCLHPIVQIDEDLEVALGNESLLKKHEIAIDPLLLTMEYRRIANGYSSRHTEKTIDRILISHLQEVNEMLIADKVQNRADFELHHLATHPRSKQLATYFANWLSRLGVSEDRYKELAAIMKERVL